jgi:hypothetical protein
LLAESERWTGGKQRLTATRPHEMLVADDQQVLEPAVTRGAHGEAAGTDRQNETR